VTGGLVAALPRWRFEAPSSFDANFTNWGSYDARSSPFAAPGGQWVAKVTASGRAEADGYTLDDWPGAVSRSTAGVRYLASAWVKGTRASAGEPLELVIRETGRHGRVDSVVAESIRLGTAYLRIAGSYTAQRTGDHIDMYLRRPPGTIRPGDAFYASLSRP
jgi:hypothetical protein